MKKVIMEAGYHCNTCNRIVKPLKVRKGNALLEIVLWFLFIIPGVIYRIWRLRAGYQLICPICRKPTLIKVEEQIPKTKSEFVRKDSKSRLLLAVFGNLDKEITDHLAKSLTNFYISIQEQMGFIPSVEVSFFPLPSPDRKSGFFLPSTFLDKLETMSGSLKLGITEEGIYSISDGRYVFGNGYGGNGILSTYRFRKRNDNIDKLKERVGKEIIKILGLSCGIVPCEKRECIFAYHRHVEDLDGATGICEYCMERILRAQKRALGGFPLEVKEKASEEQIPRTKQENYTPTSKDISIAEKLEGFSPLVAVTK